MRCCKLGDIDFAGELIPFVEGPYYGKGLKHGDC